MESPRRCEPGRNTVTTLNVKGSGRLGEILLHPDRVSEQLLTLRMIQTLTVLDVLHYREQVFTLGQYGDESTAGQSYSLANQLM